MHTDTTRSLKGACDLHTHSVYSDGTDTPEEIVKTAEALGLTAVALCDHNTIAGLPEFFEAASDKKVTAVGGVEITADYYGKEVHILGLLIEECHFDALNLFLEQIQFTKDRANYELCKKIVSAGYDIKYERIVESGKKGTINRVHFANELIRCGYFSTVKEAFDKLLSEEHGLYIPTKRVDFTAVLQLLHSLSIISVLAHPFLNLDEQEIRSFITEAKQTGLVAMETDYSMFDREQAEKAKALCDEYGLLKCGGSDYHGTAKPHISLGTGRGDLRIPDSYYKQFKKMTYKSE